MSNEASILSANALGRPARGWSRPWTGTATVKLSILMPAFNEAETIERAVHAVLSVPFDCDVELIVVDDGSDDETPEILSRIRSPRLISHRHQVNRGKGAALLTAARLASGTHIVPFDADLEYAPEDIATLLAPVLAGRCDIVFGTRVFGVNTVYQSYRYAAGGRLLTRFANVLFDSYVSDLHTCLKLLPLEFFRSLRLRETGFGLDTELAARILSQGVRPFEVPVSYHSRTHEQGKKISWKDGLECLAVLTRVRLTGRTRRTVPTPSVGNLVALPNRAGAEPRTIDLRTFG